MNDGSPPLGVEPRWSKAIGIFSIVAGGFLLAAGVALLGWVLPALDYTGQLRLLTLLMFAGLALIGASSLAQGVYMLRRGRQSSALRYSILVIAGLFIVVVFLFNQRYGADG